MYGWDRDRVNRDNPNCFLSIRVNNATQDPNTKLKCWVKTGQCELRWSMIKSLVRYFNYIHRSIDSAVGR